MSTETIVAPAYTETEALLLNLPRGTGISARSIYAGHSFSAHCRFPDDDINGEFCHGSGNTIADAIDDMMRKFDLAKSKGKILTTPAAVKAAVVELMAEHKAAPASFRAAVDDLRVADR